MPRVALPIQLDMETRRMLDKFVHSASTPQSLALRSRIVLAAADGSANQQIAAALKIPPITVGKWRRSFAIHGVEGLRDAPRSGRPTKYDFGLGTRCKRACVSNRTIRAAGPYALWRPNSDCPPALCTPCPVHVDQRAGTLSTHY